jgi:hypothetical protein
MIVELTPIVQNMVDTLKAEISRSAMVQAKNVSASNGKDSKSPNKNPEKEIAE